LHFGQFNSYSSHVCVTRLVAVTDYITLNAFTGADPGWWQLWRSPPKTYESNFAHHDFVQFEKQHSRYKVILPPIVVLEQCCKEYFISLTVA